MSLVTTKALADGQLANGGKVFAVNQLVCEEDGRHVGRDFHNSHKENVEIDIATQCADSKRDAVVTE